MVVRAGDDSLHPHWTQDLATRDWDLVVSYYGDDPGRFRDDGTTRIDGTGLKWSGLHDLLSRDAFWQRYDFIWCPDDDLAIAQDGVSRLFASMAQLELRLAQPALSWASHYSHAVTVRHPSFKVRMTNFVEIMAPCFDRGFLEACLPTFRECQSGWGLDWVWPRLQPHGAQRCGIIDNVEMTHTRPVGGPTYARLRQMGIDPRSELAAVMQKFGIATDARPLVLAAIDHQGGALDGADAAAAAVIRASMASDWAEFRRMRSRRNGPAADARHRAAAVGSELDGGGQRALDEVTIVLDAPLRQVER